MLLLRLFLMTFSLENDRSPQQVVIMGYKCANQVNYPMSTSEANSF